MFLLVRHCRRVISASSRVSDLIADSNKTVHPVMVRFEKLDGKVSREEAKVAKERKPRNPSPPLLLLEKSSNCTTPVHPICEVVTQIKSGEPRNTPNTRKGFWGSVVRVIGVVRG